MNILTKIFFILILLLAVTAGNPAQGTQDYIIGFNSSPGASEEALIEALGGEIHYRYDLIPAYAITLPTQAYGGLLHNPHVAFIEHDAQISIVGETTPVNMITIKANQVWPTGNTGQGIKVAVLDTGIDYTHPDLSVNYKGGWDFVNNDADPRDDNGHGTHVAGTIAAKKDGQYVIGVAPDAWLYAVKVANSSGSGSYSRIIAGIDWAVKNKMSVINISMGGSSSSTGMKNSCDAALMAGVQVVASAGNSGNTYGTGDNILYPAKFNSVIAVGSTNSLGTRSSFSCTGPALDFAAPGSGITSDRIGPWPEGVSYTVSKSGTSMAAPHVTGCYALMIKDGWTTPASIKIQLIATATDKGSVGFDWLYGNGLVNIYRAVIE